jgi:hypothetical protein
VPRLRRLLSTLREVFGIRLVEAIGEGGPMTLFIAGDQLYARTQDGRLFNMDHPTQALLMVGEEPQIRPLTARERKRRTRAIVRKPGRATQSHEGKP